MPKLGDRPRLRLPPNPNLPLGVAPQCQKVRAQRPLDEHDLRQCARSLSWSAGTGPIVATFATSVNEPWLLGLSAARLGLPLVVAGLGRSFTSHFNWWLGYGKKLPGSRRAAQLIHALAPDSSVVWVDSTDTVIVNPLAGSAARAVAHVMESKGPFRVLAGAECWSWPRCYEADYARDEEHVRCKARSPTCYPNSGTYLASSAGMDAFFASQNDTWQSFLGTPMSNAECTHDQGILQHMVLNRTRHPRYAGLEMQLDDSSSFFLNLHECKPPQFWKLRNLSMCYYKPHDPLQHVVHELRGNRSMLWFKPGLEAPAKSETMLSRKQLHGWHRPWIAHANGDHGRLKRDATLERLSADLSADTSLLDYPVLLVDSLTNGTCTTTTIRDLYRVRTGNLMKTSNLKQVSSSNPSRARVRAKKGGVKK